MTYLTIHQGPVWHPAHTLGGTIHQGPVWHPAHTLGGTIPQGTTWHPGHTLGGVVSQGTAWHPGSTLSVGTAWNPGQTWGIGGLSTTGNTNPAWNSTGGLNQSTGWNYNPGNTSGWLAPTFGTQLQEVAQGIASQASQIAFVPHQGGVNGGSYAPGTTGIHSWQGGQQIVGGVTQSFATELAENNNEYVISFDVPGINIEDLDLSLAGSTILINGIRKGSHDSSLAYSEIARGSISRAIGVPFEVSPNKAINTSLENGVLKIRIAKDGHSDKKLSGRKVKIG